jgi:Uma2 family endonuclease
MTTLAFVPADVYLRSTYDPDREYVDGVVLERALGERDHSESQRNLIVFFWNRRKQWNVHVFPEQRVQVSPTRFRVPDVCVYVGEKPKEQIFVTPPFICIEVLSPEDRIERYEEKFQDYVRFGVRNIWVIDPATRQAWVYLKEGLVEAVSVLHTESPAFDVPLSEIFEALDE